jgi:hypothetical protein
VPPEARPPPKRVIELGSVAIDGGSEEDLKVPKQTKKLHKKNSGSGRTLHTKPPAATVPSGV